jgi:sec-independent protein translocase protein TatA
MALIGWPELILILAILVFLFGATRMKGLAKGLGESVREFKNISKEQPDDSPDESIIEVAKKMGIQTEGKKIKQILHEMEERTQE